MDQAACMKVLLEYDNGVERKQTYALLLPKDKQAMLEKTQLLKQQTGFHHRNVLCEARIGVPGKSVFMGLKYQVLWQKGLTVTRHTWDKPQTLERDKSELSHSCHKPFEVLMK